LICALGVCSLLMGGCADTAGSRQELYTVHTVRAQDTVYSIAWRYGLDFRDLARWNNLGPDFHITVGQALTLSPKPESSAGPAAAPAKRVQPPSGAVSRAAVASAPWAWPTDRGAAPRAVPGGGILLAGRMGQDIRAAAPGRVVYSGTGIRGYGNLIIIKHGENLLSAYAHNRESLVREGQEVLGGQVIAHMGEGAPQKPVLYFEIRRNGRPIDPLRLLPP
jgi:lipoprotein NlpD